MDRFLFRIAFALLLAAAIPARAQTPSPSASPETTPDDPKTPATSKVEEARRRFQQMTPEQRLKLQDNLQKWKGLSNEERQALRFQLKMRTDHLEKSASWLEKKNGWKLSPESHQKLLERLDEERKRIEDTLRKEEDEKRRPMTKKMMDALEAEFAPIAAGSPAPSPTATPASSPSPAP